MSEGFFTKTEVASTSRPDGKLLSCVSCTLNKSCTTPRMKPFGNFKKGIMNIGEAVSEIDDRYGKPFQGKIGKLLQSTYKKFGVDLFEDCININATNCYTENTPDNFNIDCCRKFVLKYIEEYKPKVIILFGGAPIYSVIGKRWKKDLGAVVKWRGWQIPDQEYKAFVCPVYSPDFVENFEGKEVTTIWENDLKMALECVERGFPTYVEPKIEIIEDLRVLDDIKDETEVAYDFETTGIKPHGEGHKIICASVADSPNHVFVFMMPPKKSLRQPFVNLLKNKSIYKIAQNLKFEHTWSEVKLNTIVEGWVWDTMLATHLLDNRQGITSLKFQSYTQLGIADYDSEIAPYLKAVDNDNANSINRIMEFLMLPGGVNKCLTYCAYDSINVYRLSMIQKAEIELPF